MASFPQASPPTPCAPLYPPPIRATCPAHLIRLDFTTRTILVRVLLTTKNIYGPIRVYKRSFQFVDIHITVKRENVRTKAAEM